MLAEGGLTAVTLTAVAERVGCTHSNLLHHFGSAAVLRKELAKHIAVRGCDNITAMVEAMREKGVAGSREVVDMAFEGFSSLGGGALLSWLLMSDNEEALSILYERLDAMVHELHPHETADHGKGDEGAPMTMHRLNLALTLMALGDALVGEGLTQALGLPRGAARDIAHDLAKQAVASDQARGLGPKLPGDEPD